MRTITRRNFQQQLLTYFACFAGTSSFNRLAFSQESNDHCNRLFIMDPWFYKSGLTEEQKSALLHELGVPRFSFSLDQPDAFAKRQAALQKDGIKVVSAYCTVEIDDGTMPPSMGKLIQTLKGSDTLIWMSLTSQKFKPSNPAGDEAAVALLKETAEAADDAGLVISLYPHFNFWNERTEDSIRILAQVGRKNVGCTFNLYHWLKVEGPENLPEKAQATLPYLNCITVNGSFQKAKDMKVEEAILPLGEGDVDVKEFVKTFVELGYTGPIGLQGYGIEGDIPEKLKRSIQEWRRYCKDISGK